MTTYPADAIEAAAKAFYDLLKSWSGRQRCEWEQLSEEAREQYMTWAKATVAAFDAAMLAHGWKRVPREPNAAMVDAAPLSDHTPTWCSRAMYDAAPEVKP